MTPVAPGRAHALWLFGHLAYAPNNAGLRFAFGEPFVMPDAWFEMFAPAFRGGKPPHDNRSEYPSVAEITDVYTRTIDRVCELTLGLSDSDLESPPRGPMPKTDNPHFQKIGSLLIYLAQHDAYHRGQMAFAISK